MSQPNNNIVISVSPKSIFENAYGVIDSSVNYNQGDIIAFDTGSGLLKPFAATGDAQNILGVARQTIVDGVPKSPYYGTQVDNSQQPRAEVGPVYGVVAFFTLKTGDTFNPGDKVYATTTDPQTVTSIDNTGSGLNLGIFQGPLAVASAVAGQVGNVLVGARYSLGGGISF